MCERTEQPLSLEDWVAKYGAKPKQWLVGGMPNYQGGNTNRGRLVTKEMILDRCVLSDVTGCWLWQGTKAKEGYGKAKEHGKSVRIHRKAFELWKGAIPDGLCVLHRCPGGDNPACCNPSHLRVGTKYENSMDRSKNASFSRNPRKLTFEQAEAIRKDPRPATVACLDYGVSATAIRCIRRGEHYLVP